jgi:tetratricopeptide (TPR) repeat protein
LPQPVPARVTAERLAPALRSLGARDAPRAALLARRALDVLGPRHATLRAAFEEVADAASDGGLRARVVERWIAAGAPAAERGPLLLTLAEHHRAVGDVQRELSAYVRAARAGVDLATVRERIDTLHGSEQAPDAELALLEARAELHLDEGRTDTAAQAFRELGAALWDMADDRPRAVQAWLRAAQLDSAKGYATLRRDLSAFADVGYAVDCLAELVEREGDRARAGIIATEAARAACEGRAYPRAIALARTALERHPSHAEALAIAELASERIGRLHEMSPIYDYAARGALGRFGRRAAHHRAARFFEAHAPMLALKHAAQAFIAVPSEGTTLTLLERTAERAQRRSVAVRTVEHVAELSRSMNVRAAWLLRAATLTSRDLEGARQRVDLLLKAAVLSPNPVTLGMLSVAARELVSLAPDDGEAIAMRLERASDSLAKKLEGPDGARISITFAELALDLFEDAAWAWRAIERALESDADVDEYVRLTRFADALARAEGAKESLARVVAACEKPYSNVGVALLRLVGSVASSMGDGPRSVRAFVQAAEKDPDDDETIVQADAAVTAHPEPAFVERLSKKFGVFRRSQALRSIAAKKNEQGDHAAAVGSLERALQIAPQDARADIARELDDTLKRAGRGEEAVLRAMAAPGVSAKGRAEQWQSLAKIREERGDKEGATDALLQAATDDPGAAAWAAVERAAEASGREHIRVQALQNLALHVDDRTRLGVQKRLARAEGARGSLAAAEQAWREVLSSDPGDSEADVAIEALLVARASSS